MAETTFPSGLVVRSHPIPKGFDPLKASDQELVTHGFPPRPKDPTLLSQWENLMQSVAGSTFIEPKFRRTDRRHGPIIRSGTETSNNWSGGIVLLPPNTPAGGKFYIVTGRWTVPNPAPAAGNSETYSCSVWIGIDGNTTADLVQAGVECDAESTGAQGIYPWWEWLPEHEIQITNLAVDVGDFLICTISATSRTSANIFFSNNTKNQGTTFGVTAPTGAPTLVGNCAEWIVERPQVGGVLSQLANYGSVTFQEAWGGTNLAGSDAVRNPSEGDAISMTGDDGSVVSNGNVGFRQVNCSFV